MFQYAFFLGLRAKNIPCKSIVIGKEIGHNGYELERIFGIKPSKSVWQYLLKRRRTYRLLQIFMLFHHLAEVKHYYFQKEIFLEIHKNVFFDAFWQTEQYFSHCEMEIRKAFKFNQNLLNEETKRINEILKRRNSVSVHIRRGDYQSPEYINNLGSACSIDFYKSAISIIKEKVEQPLFVFFSDDMTWVKENIRVENAIYVDHNHNSESWQDMYLMSQCHHHIIANSSFSWWGAWLNPDKQKIVIAPKKWWGDMACEDTVPSTWIRL